MWRRQLPAYSPLPLGAVIAASAGLVSAVDTAAAAAESAVRARFGAGDLLLTDSGTGALTLAIRAALREHAGAPVALPAYGCYDLATAADGADAPVLLYDLDPATLAPDIASLGAALAAGARAVVLVHLYGIPVDPGPVLMRAAKAGATVIEDAAQGSGARLHGLPLGLAGDFGVLSFGRGKGDTAGRGGALLLNSGIASVSAAAIRGQSGAPVRGAKELVQLAAQWLLGRPSLYSIPSALPFLRLGETIYHGPSPVRGISAVAARALATTLPLGEREASVRRANAARLLARVGAHLTAIPVPGDAVPGYVRLPFLADDGARREALTPEGRAMGLMPGYPLALCDLGGFAARVLNRELPFPGARTLARRLITVPVHSLLRSSDQARLDTWVRGG